MMNSQHDILPGFAGRQSTTMPSHPSSMKVHSNFLGRKRSRRRNHTQALQSNTWVLYQIKEYEQDHNTIVPTPFGIEPNMVK